MLAVIYFLTAVLFVNGELRNNPAVLPRTNTNNRILCPPVKRLEVLPGRGWDNLRNKDMGEVIAFQYSQCKTTDDGEYLIPDNVYVIPLKKSDLKLSSEMFEHWLNYSSVTSSSFRVNAGGTFFGSLSIEGSFSAEYENAKRHQIDEKSITTRVTLRNTIYSVGIEPTIELDPGLRSLLDSALIAIKNNNTDKVDVLMEFIVKDYGTHYSTHMDAGAILSKEDFISTKFVQDNWESKSSINTAASASFSDCFDFGFSTQNNESESFLEGYRKSTTSSSITAYGGGSLKYKITVNEWVDSIPNNLVAVDRSGEPLHFIITPTTFPGVPPKLLLRLRNELEQSIKQYYSYNTHKGCLNRNSPNFDFMANVDDGSCGTPLNNYILGGVYQTCNAIVVQIQGLCENITQKNPLTSDFSCPPNFIPVLLHKGFKEFVSPWFSVEFQTYWCVASVFPVTPNTGLMFGGVFTSFLNNPLTQSKNCPPFFYPLRMGSDLKVCVSDDYQMGARGKAEFGGFFSCSKGNPLLLNDTVKLPDGGFPRGCPDGYTQHMAVIENDCEIHYCVTAETFLATGQIPIVLPPFRDSSSLFRTMALALSTSTTVERSLSLVDIAGIVVSCIAILSALVGVWIYRKRKTKARCRNSNDENVSLLPMNDKPSTTSQQETAASV